jgi:hypothetical protein
MSWAILCDAYGFIGNVVFLLPLLLLVPLLLFVYFEEDEEYSSIPRHSDMPHIPNPEFVVGVVGENMSLFVNNSESSSSSSTTF